MHVLAVANETIGFDCGCKRGLRDRLNLVAAAEAHVVWKNRLGNFVRGISLEPLAAALLGQDGVCQLGDLIDGAAFFSLRETDEYWQLRTAHYQFHQLADVVFEKLQANDLVGAASLFENEYSAALRETLQSLSKINRLLQG
jgi:hypothetical protein